MKMIFNVGSWCLYTGIKRIVHSMSHTMKGQLERERERENERVCVGKRNQMYELVKVNI